MPRFLPLGPVLLFCASVPVWGEDVAKNEAPVFERDVRLILKQHCFHCHGEEPELSGGFDVRLVKLIQKGGDSGPALVTGDHAASLIFQKIASGEMPPGEKKLSDIEKELIARWIDGGAKTARPEPESPPAHDAITEEEKSHWSFQPIVRPPLPALATASGQTPVDAFIASALAGQQLTMSAEADRRTLIRRLSFDLRGLPPTVEEVEAFVTSTAPDAYEQLVETFLSSPQYGERWARHWLDIAGYADSDGYSPKDLERKWAWKYRDYVVRAFNDDKPFDQFIVEQLAGDELLTPPYVDLSDAQAEKLIATGFLRMGPDGTGDGEVDQNVARNDVMAETIKIVSTSLLGLTVGCAQCHNHRYDPISQADYYRMRSIFEPAYNWQKWRAPNARLVSQWSTETRKRVTEVDAEIRQVQKEREAALDEVIAETLKRELTKLPEEIHEKAMAARSTAEKERSDEQKELIKQYPFLNVNRGTVYLYQPDRLTGFNKKWDERTAETKAKRPADDLIQCLTEIPGEAPMAKLFSRGDFQQPREALSPSELAVISSGGGIAEDDPTIPTSGRRLAYARHLTDGKHPLVARVLVNRLWMHHFGRGLVSTTGDFGILGERPTHPELLDWLADEFMTSGWSVKHIHRLLLTSATYRQSSRHREDLDAVDPENRLLGRMNVRRLEAEVLRDALLATAGRLSDRQGGSPIPVTPDEVGQIVVGEDTRDSAGRPTNKVVKLGEDEFRRSLYIAARRTLPLGMLEPFDAPLMVPNCEQRPSSTVAPQSLLLMNNEFVIQQSQTLASRLRAEAGDEPAKLVTAAWRAVFGQDPTDRDRDFAVTYLADQTEYFTKATPPTAATPAAETPLSLALATLCQALVSSNLFLYVD